MAQHAEENILLIDSFLKYLKATQEKMSTLGKKQVDLPMITFKDSPISLPTNEVLSSQLKTIHLVISTASKDVARMKAIKNMSRHMFADATKDKVPGVNEFINTVLGQKFKEGITNKKYFWIQNQITRESYAMTLHGKYIPNESGCEWFKAKLIKAGVKEADIKFDQHNSQYQLRIENIQNLKKLFSKAEESTHENLFSF